MARNVGRLVWVCALGALGLLAVGAAFLWITVQSAESGVPHDEAYWNEIAEEGIARYTDSLKRGDVVAAERYFKEVDTTLWALSRPTDGEADQEEYERYLRRMIRFREATVGEGRYLADALYSLISFRSGSSDYHGVVEDCERFLSRIEAGFGRNSPLLEKALFTCGFAMKKVGDDVRGDELLDRGRSIRARWHPDEAEGRWKE